MWAPGSLAFLAPMFWLGTRSLFRGEARSSLSPRPSPRRGEGVRAAWDLLRLPGLGRFLRWRRARLCFQIPLLLLAAAVIYDGLAGPGIRT